jgi:hypothetical protein
MKHKIDDSKQEFIDLYRYLESIQKDGVCMVDPEDLKKLFKFEDDPTQVLKELCMLGFVRTETIIVNFSGMYHKVYL